MNYWQKIEEKIQSLINKQEFISVEWNVISNNRTASRGLIQADDSNTELQAIDKPIYRIYSMTKPVVSMAAIIAIEQGKLSLKDPLTKFLPYFSDAKVQLRSGSTEQPNRPISILDLLTHNSGLSYGFNSNCHIGKIYRKENLIHNSNLPLEDFVKLIATYPLAFHPGSQWQYSVSTDVLARVLELLFDQSIDRILSDLIFKPLGMRDTGYSVMADQNWRLMPIYGEPNLDLVTDKLADRKKLTKIDLSKFYSQDQKKCSPRGGHGLFSTLADYTKFCIAILQDLKSNEKNLVSQQTLKFALKNQIPAEQIPISLNGEARTGYGWNLIGRVRLQENNEFTKSRFEEFGWAGAASTYFWIDPNLNSIGVVMTQHLGHSYPLGEKLENICSAITIMENNKTSLC